MNSNKKHIFEVVACAWDSMWNHGLKMKLLAPLFYLINRIMIAKAENVVYVTNRFLQRRYPNKRNSIGCSNVVLPSVDEAVLHEKIFKIENRSGNLVLGTGGAVNVRSKGQEYVIRAIAKLKEEGLIYYYKMAGGGDNTYLKNLAQSLGVSDQIQFCGLVPRDKMMDFYDSLDIYIHPSLQEGLPRVLIEAESRALPALGSTTAGIPELLNDDCLFGNKDVDAIIKVLKSFNKEKMLKTAKENFERSKQYTIDILNDRRLAFYRKVVNN
jgi:glycosyltransferase involved in cell wall biosynthesis